MKAYKGFNKDLSCRGFKFEEGKTHTEKEANCVQNGFHCAENPLDCLTYYPDWNRSVYYIVEAAGDIDEDGTDTKISCTEMRLIHKLTKDEFIAESLLYMKRYPLRKAYQRYVQEGRASAGELFVIARGKKPLASGELGAVIGMAKEKVDSRDIEKIAVYTVDGDNIKPGIWYTVDGVIAEEQEDL